MEFMAEQEIILRDNFPHLSKGGKTVKCFISTKPYRITASEILLNVNATSVSRTDMGKLRPAGQIRPAGPFILAHRH